MTGIAAEFVDRYEELLGKKSIIVQNINPDSERDRSLILLVALRNLGVDNFPNLLDELVSTFEVEPDPERQEFLLSLTVQVVEIVATRVKTGFSSLNAGDMPSRNLQLISES